MNKNKEMNLRMTDVEASEKYPDSFVLMRMDSIESPMGTVLYLGDSRKEVTDVLKGLVDQSLCGIIEGVNLQRSLGGVVVVSG